MTGGDDDNILDTPCTFLLCNMSLNLKVIQGYPVSFFLVYCHKAAHVSSVAGTVNKLTYACVVQNHYNFSDRFQKRVQ